MSLPRPLENNNEHNLNLSESCPVQADHLIYMLRTYDDNYELHGLTQGIHQVYIHDISGREIKHLAVIGGYSPSQLSLKGAAKGVYMVAVSGVGVVKINH